MIPDKSDKSDKPLSFVDADGHILEHPTEMLDYAPRAYRDRIWHIETEPRSGACSTTVASEPTACRWRASPAWAKRRESAHAEAS